MTEPFDDLEALRLPPDWREQQRAATRPRITTVAAMLNHWCDADFGYDLDYDFFAEHRAIDRGDGKVLCPVCTLTSAARFSVHFCTQAREVWVVDLHQLRPLVEYERPTFVRYVPSSRSAGLPSARGYALPCSLLEEVGFCFVDERIAKVFEWLTDAPNKTEGGKRAEKCFDWLQKRAFFPCFPGHISRASAQDDVTQGVDFWILSPLEPVGVQVKLDSPGGRRGTGNLFFQTHTLPVRQAADWYRHTPKPVI